MVNVQHMDFRRVVLGAGSVVLTLVALEADYDAVVFPHSTARQDIEAMLDTPHIVTEVGSTQGR